MAKKLINLKKPLFIDLLDQYLDLGGYVKYCLQKKIDGCVPLFQSLYYNRGYAKTDINQNIKKISEKDKKPISTNSTACVSYFKNAELFFDNAKNMKKKKKIG